MALKCEKINGIDRIERSQNKMSLIKYLAQKEFHNPVIDGVIGGIGEGVGDELYEIARKKSLRRLRTNWGDLGTIAKALNYLEIRSTEMQMHYYSMYEMTKEKEGSEFVKQPKENNRLETYCFFEGLTKILTKTALVLPILFGYGGLITFGYILRGTLYPFYLLAKKQEMRKCNQHNSL